MESILNNQPIDNADDSNEKKDDDDDDDDSKESDSTDEDKVRNDVLLRLNNLPALQRSAIISMNMQDSKENDAKDADDSKEDDNDSKQKDDKVRNKVPWRPNYFVCYV